MRVNNKFWSAIIDDPFNWLMDAEQNAISIFII